MSIFSGIKLLLNGEKINPFFLDLRNRKNYKRLQNFEFSIVANNCVSGTIYKDLGIEYKTPFVGLYIFPSDFVRMCHDLEGYLKKPLVEVTGHNLEFPVAQLGDILIYFMHYSNFAEANSIWLRRLERFNFHKTFFILVQKDGCTDSDMISFDNLPVSRKIILTSELQPHLHSAIQMKSFRGQPEIGELLNFKSRYIGKRYMYDFDFIQWLNS